MKPNRRNYYRVLHLQPECPPELIKASYRTLMGTLRLHPDLGGDHETASLINEAYAQLSDPDRRAAYDRELKLRFPRMRATGSGIGSSTQRPWAEPAHAPARPGDASGARGASDTATGRAETSSTPRSPVPGFDPSHWLQRQRCPMCASRWSAPLRRDSRCLRCEAPLSPVPEVPARGHELFGRRKTTRHDRQQWAALLAGFPSRRLPARWRNRSLTGLSVAVPEPVRAGLAIRIIDDTLDAVALIRACRPAAHGHTLHAQLLSACFLKASGVFVSRAA